MTRHQNGENNMKTIKMEYTKLANMAHLVKKTK